MTALLVLDHDPRHNRVVGDLVASLICRVVSGCGNHVDNPVAVPHCHLLRLISATAPVAVGALDALVALVPLAQAGWDGDTLTVPFNV